MFYLQRFSFPCPSVFIQMVTGLKKNNKGFCSKHMSRSGGWGQGPACTRHFWTEHLLIGNNMVSFSWGLGCSVTSIFSPHLIFDQIKWPCERNCTPENEFYIALKMLGEYVNRSWHEDGTQLYFPCCSPHKLVFYKGYFKQSKTPVLKEITTLWLRFFNKKMKESVSYVACISS